MESTAVRGLAAVDKLYQDYGCRARELKNQGKRVLGYLCALTPVEIITAAGFSPFRLKGSVHEPITKADVHMETIVCPLIRSCFDLALKGKYDFLDGIVIPHSCDSLTRSYSTIRYTLGLPYSHFVNIPHSTKEISLEFLKAELDMFRRSLGRFVGREITDEALIRSIQLHNENRAKVRELYELRKPEPPLMSGTEVIRTLVAAMSLPVEESSQLLSSVIEEVKGREGKLSGSLRIMVIGAQIDDEAFIRLIEEGGANVVADSVCVGSREYFPEAKTTVSPLEALAERYLRGVNCPRTYHEFTGPTYQDDLEARFGPIGRAIREFRADGVILYILKYCDPFGFEVPARMKYLESLNVPVLHLEDEYSMASIARLRTRIQAFLEMIAK